MRGVAVYLLIKIVLVCKFSWSGWFQHQALHNKPICFQKLSCFLLRSGNKMSHYRICPTQA